MSNDNHPTPPSEAPDGSTDITEEQREYTEALGDGSPGGNETEDPHEDTDTASGGDPESNTSHEN